MFRSVLRAGALAAIVGLWLATPRLAFAQQYVATPLGTSVNEAGGINNQTPFMMTGSGDVANGNYHAIRITTAGILDLGTLGGLISEGYAINDSGAVVGLAQTAAGDYHAYIWQNAATGMVDIDGRPGHYSEAWAINSAGVVVGLAETTAITNPRTFHAFRWTATPTPTMTDLGTFGGQDSVAYGINAAGQITGAAQTAAQREHAYIWTAQAGLTDLGTLPTGAWSYGFAITDSGRIAGVAQFNQNNNTFHAVRWDSSGGSTYAIADLGTLNAGLGRNSEALAANNNGQIVGWSSTDPQDSIRHAFLWQNGTMTDLNTLLAASSTGWVLLRADGINNQGQIVGEGIQNGVPRLFVLTPA